MPFGNTMDGWTQMCMHAMPSDVPKNIYIGESFMQSEVVIVIIGVAEGKQMFEIMIALPCYVIYTRYADSHLQ